MTTKLDSPVWTSTAVYFGASDTPTTLIFINDTLIAYYDPFGRYDKPTIFVLQGMNRDEFRANLSANFPSFCQENNIGDGTIFDIFTKKELKDKAIACRVNAQNRLKMV